MHHFDGEILETDNFYRSKKRVGLFTTPEARERERESKDKHSNMHTVVVGNVNCIITQRALPTYIMMVLYA